MPRKSRLTLAQVDTLRNAVNGGASYRKAGKLVGVSSSTVMRALGRTRSADEFQGSRAARPPQRATTAWTWTLESIRGARDAQMRGMFRQPVRLAEALRTDAALYAAYHNRIAPHNAIETRIIPCSSTRGASVAKRALTSIACARSTLGGILGTMANHGLAIGYNEHVPSDDGTRVDFRHCEWPLEYVTWNPHLEILETQTREGGLVPIVHGDGRWVVYRKFLQLPWTQEACILPAALVWAAIGNGVKDWAQSSTSHGRAKMLGELPEGVPAFDAAGLTPQAVTFLNMMQDMVTGESGAGIYPFGSKVQFVANSSTAWQVFSELVLNREKAAARIYLGTDAMLGSVGGAPGVDIATLFGVATTKVQGDFEAIEQAWRTGISEPWTAINFGDSTYAPSLEYLMPDPDAEAKSKQESERRTRLFDLIKRMREEQFTVDQETVDALAKMVGVSPAPKLAEAKERTVTITLAPTDIARVVKVDEARNSQGLAPLVGDPRGALFIAELEQYAQAKADAAAAAPAAPAPTPEPAAP